MEDGLIDAPAVVEAPAQEEIKADLESLKRMVTDWQSLTLEARKDSQIDDDYYHNYQLTSAERAVLRKRRQPDGTFNHVRLAVNGTLGVIIQGSSDPRAYPREPKDEASADIASKTLRFSADESNFPATKFDCAKNYLVEGSCAVIIEVDGDRRVAPGQIRWEELVYDPRSRRQDFKDAKYLGIAKWQYADDVIRANPGAKIDIEAALTSSSFLDDDITRDRPNGSSLAWCDRKERRVLVVEIYYLDGERWIRAVFHAGGILSVTVSPYQDDKKRPCCPIEAQSCYVDRENNRYGIVRDMRSPQDEINKRRQKLLYLVSVRQLQQVSPDAAEVSADEARREAARPDGVIPAGWQVVPTQDMASGQANLLAEAKAEIERMGPNPAVLGRQGENQSGRANLVRQQAGMTEQAVIFTGIDEWELRVYRQMWHRQRQFWKAPMWARVTGEENKPEFVGVNQPVTDEFGQVLGYEDTLGQLDVDIILDRTPDTANLQQEQFAMLAELAKAGALGQNPGPLLLQASSLPEKKKLIEKLQGEGAQPTPEQQQAQQLQLQAAAIKLAQDQAAIGKTKSEEARNLATTEQIKVETALLVAPTFPPMPDPTQQGFVPMPAAGVTSGAPLFTGA